MDDFVYRKNLLDPQLVRQLCQRSDKPAVLRLSIHLAIIVFAGWLVSLAGLSWWLLPAWVVYGTAVVFLFAPLHECIHRTAFRSRAANNVIAAVCGFVLLLPARYFRLFHFAHHRYTNDPARDPELASAKPVSRGQYIWAMTGLGSYWWPQIRSILRHVAGHSDEPFIQEFDRSKVIAEARWHAFGYVVIAAASVLADVGWILIYWVFPIVLGMIALRLFLLAEHTGCETSDNMLKNTRTTLTNPMVNLLAWNMPYHAEHHAFPAVPFHKLPDLHQHLRDRLGVVSKGYRRFHLEFIDSI